MCPCFEINQFCVSHAAPILFIISSFMHMITDGINAATSFFFSVFPISVSLPSFVTHFLSFPSSRYHSFALPFRGFSHSLASFPSPFLLFVLTQSLFLPFSLFLSLTPSNICVTYLEYNTNELFLYTSSMSNIKMSLNLAIPNPKPNHPEEHHNRISWLN